MRAQEVGLAGMQTRRNADAAIKRDLRDAKKGIKAQNASKNRVRYNLQTRGMSMF